MLDTGTLHRRPADDIAVAVAQAVVQWLNQ